MAVLFGRTRAWGRLRSFWGHDSCSQRAQFSGGNLQLNELRIGEALRRAGVCCNKWFMTGHGHTRVSLCVFSWTHADRSPKKPIDSRQQQSVHVHGCDLPLIDCFIIISGRNGPQEMPGLMPDEQYFRWMLVISIINCKHFKLPGIITVKQCMQRVSRLIAQKPHLLFHTFSVV